MINLIVRGRICSLHEFIWAILQQWHAVRFVLALCSEEGVGGGRAYKPVSFPVCAVRSNKATESFVRGLACLQHFA